MKFPVPTIILPLIPFILATTIDLDRRFNNDNALCQVIDWNGRIGGCQFLLQDPADLPKYDGMAPSSIPSMMCHMASNRLGPRANWRQGDCMEVFTGSRSDDTSKVWGGCEVRRAWRVKCPEWVEGRTGLGDRGRWDEERRKIDGEGRGMVRRRKGMEEGDWAEWYAYDGDYETTDWSHWIPRSVKSVKDLFTGVLNKEQGEKGEKN